MLSNYFHEFLKSFLLLIAIMDPVAVVPVMLLLTGKMNREEQTKNVNKAMAVASILLFVFLFAGSGLLDFLGVSISSFRIAGGIILLLMSLEFVLGIDLRGKTAERYDVAVIPLATPLITGPGVLVTVMLLVIRVGYILTVFVSGLCLLLTWIILREGFLIHKLIGKQGTDIVTRIMGLLLAGLAVEFIRVGLKG